MKRFRLLVSLSVIAIFFISIWGTLPAAAAPDSPDARLQGVWQTVTFEKNGGKAARRKGK